MTTDPRTLRRVAALVLVPVSAALFGGSLAWATATAPTTEPEPVPVATVETDPRIAAAQARIEAATKRLAEVQASLDARTEAARSAAAQPAAPPAATAPVRAPAPAAPAPVKAAPAAKAPAVQTTTRASTKR